MWNKIINIDFTYIDIDRDGALILSLMSDRIKKYLQSIPRP